ncbi:hypothetical protein M0813_29812 [Anaeramoeba flamelloides]|uniref:Uncharacterized protein n=1 Tax=Anaeramoeba flamelloides TaxID=1746091 RepID=A0ABQ8XLW0_9EUKA|nr:hypothetical protein M0813_29812 [Anaeramoeba flamelloides]
MPIANQSQQLLIHASCKHQFQVANSQPEPRSNSPVNSLPASCKPKLPPIQRSTLPTVATNSYQNITN